MGRGGGGVLCTRDNNACHTTVAVVVGYLISESQNNGYGADIFAGCSPPPPRLCFAKRNTASNCEAPPLALVATWEGGSLDIPEWGGGDTLRDLASREDG